MIPCPHGQEFPCHRHINCCSHGRVRASPGPPPPPLHPPLPGAAQRLEEHIQVERQGRGVSVACAHGHRLHDVAGAAPCHVHFRHARARRGRTGQHLLHVRRAEPPAVREVDRCEVGPGHARQHHQHVGLMTRASHPRKSNARSVGSAQHTAVPQRRLAPSQRSSAGRRSSACRGTRPAPCVLPCAACPIVGPDRRRRPTPAHARAWVDACVEAHDRRTTDAVSGLAVVYGSFVPPGLSATHPIPCCIFEMHSLGGHGKINLV